MKYECHGHIMAGGDSYQNALLRHRDGPDEGWIHRVFEKLADKNVTFYRDGGDKFGVSYLAKTIAPQYGIDYRTPGYIIHRSGYYGSLYGFGYDDQGDARRLIKEAKSKGADFIKIAITGMLDFEDHGGIMGDSLGRDEIDLLVQFAAEEGLGVMAHCNGAENIKNAVLAGVSSIEHGFWADDESLRLMKEHGTIWVPTCSPVLNVMGDPQFSDVALKKILDHHYAMIKAGNEMGVLIASGSDCGAYKVLQGEGTEDEYRVLKTLGVDPLKGNLKVAETFKCL